MCKNCSNNNLSEDVLNQITELKNKGEKAFGNKHFKEAKDYYFEALNIIHEPIEPYADATKLLMAIGDCCFYMKDFEACFNMFSRAIQCVDGFGNPFIHLRLGQMYYEKEDFEKSKLDLKRAYLLGGEQLFENEDEKYLKVAKEEL